MDPSDIEWHRFENAVTEVCDGCLRWLETNHPAEPVFGFGFEGDIELGLIYVSAATGARGEEDRNWWLPDWSLTYIDKRLKDDVMITSLREFSKPIEEVVQGNVEEGSWDELCRLYRWACLRALKTIDDRIHQYQFPRTDDFALVYMDEVDAHFRGIEAIESGIEWLAQRPA